jgi:hypothetical protein
VLWVGVHPKVIADRLGHTTTNITLNVYSHVVEGMQTEAAENVAAADLRDLKNQRHPRDEMVRSIASPSIPQVPSHRLASSSPIAPSRRHFLTESGVCDNTPLWTIGSLGSMHGTTSRYPAHHRRWRSRQKNGRKTVRCPAQICTFTRNFFRVGGGTPTREPPICVVAIG